MTLAIKKSMFIRKLALAALSALAITGCVKQEASQLTEPTAPAKKPNVLFISIDDLRVQLGSYGDSLAKTPSMDKLASQGMRFDQAYAQAPICMASRASIMSGLRPQSGGIFRNGPLFELIPDAQTINQHFLDAGYETVGVGKIYHHASDVKQGWSKPYFMAKKGFLKNHPEDYKLTWYGRGYLSPEAVHKAKTADEKLGREKNRGRGPAFEAADVDDFSYRDGITAKHALKELKRLSNADSPFFLAVGFGKPHLPFNAPTKYWDLYDEQDIELASNHFNPDGMPWEAATTFSELRFYHDIPKEGPVPEELAKKLIHGYYASVSYTDALVGYVMDEAEKLGVLDNTIVVLWSDHGFKLGEHAMWTKQALFDLDVRVPFIISTPDMQAKGQSTDSLVELVDVFPTLADLAGLSIPEHLPGKSLAPILDDPSVEVKQQAYFQWPSHSYSWSRYQDNHPDNTIVGYGMKTDDFRYVEWVNIDSKEVVARELYDHNIDRAENVNKADAPEYQDKIPELSKLLGLGGRDEEIPGL